MTLFFIKKYSAPDEITSNDCLVEGFGNIDVPTEATCFKMERSDPLFYKIIGERTIIATALIDDIDLSSIITTTLKKKKTITFSVNFCIRSEINNTDAFICYPGYCLNDLNSKKCENIDN